MSKVRLAPAHALALAGFVALAMAAFVVGFAVRQPWMGLTLAYDGKADAAVVRAARGPAAAIPPGARLKSISDGRDTVVFRADDFVYEPDGSLGTYANYEVFLARQQRLAAIQASPGLVVADDRGRSWPMRPAASRPLSSLPPDFWVQLVVGLFAWLIAASIWAFRSGETSARYLLLSGFSTLTFSPLAADYSTRELALPSLPFRIVNDLNFLGGSLFAASLAALLFYYPRRLAPRWVGLVIVTLFLAEFTAQEVGLFHDMTFARRFLVLIALLGSFVQAGIHWWLTRKDPVARAALQWFLLSWLVCAGVFGLGVLAPQMLGIDTAFLQGYGFSLFLLLYLGLAFGVLRFRLFDLGEWWFRVVLWAGAVLLLVAFDVAFALGLQLSAGLSLSLSLLLCGLLWLPLRGWLWSRLFDRTTVSERTQFESVVEVALSHGGDQAARWQALLEEVFDPLSVGRAEPVTAATLGEDGLALSFPAFDAIPGLRLEYAHGGRRLFTRRDLGRAGDLVGMLRHALRSRHAYEEGVAGERRRIARDMHDNIGAQLLHALHSGAADSKDRLIRDTLSDLGHIINDISPDGASLEDALADLRHETADRLQAAGLDLDWPLNEAEPVRLESGLVHTLRSITREAVSNVLKHAGARRVTVQAGMLDGTVTLAIADDGVGFDPETVARASGLANLRRRVEARGGDIAWVRDETGMRVTVALPMAAPRQS